MSSGQPRLAVLIDADNVPTWAVERLLAEVEKLGTPVIRRIYGNIATTSRRWSSLALRFALESRQQYVASVGLNATDIQMVIDAMDLLADDEADSFCLVSSDSDFTALALRLRQGNKQVFGFGEAKAPETFRLACTKYFPIVWKDDKSAGGEVIAFPRPSAQSLLPYIRTAMQKHASDDGWTLLSRIEGHLTSNVPGFKLSDYGVKTFKDLVTKTRCFEIGMAKGGILRVREKPQRGKHAATSS